MRPGAFGCRWTPIIMPGFMSLLHGGPLVDTPLHPSVQAWRRAQILEEVKAYKEQVKAGFLTLDEARARIYGR